MLASTDTPACTPNFRAALNPATAKLRAECPRCGCKRLTRKGWYYGRTSRFGDLHSLKGPYSSEHSVALMIACELINEIVKRDAQRRLPT